MFLAGLLYALGGAISYVALAMLVAGGIRAAALAWPLQRYTTEALGPILILLGMLLLELLPLPGVGMGSPRTGRPAPALGRWAALPLGALVALAFCPASAAVFFGSVLRMAARHNSWLLLPLAYGVGAALPAVVCAGLLAFSAG